MRRIKLVEVSRQEIFSGSSGEYDNTELYRICNFTNWEEVSEEDYQNLLWYSKNVNPYNSVGLVVIEELPIRDTLTEYTKKAGEKKVEWDKRKLNDEKREKTAKLARDKAVKLKESKVAEKEIKQLKRLAEKHKDILNEVISNKTMEALD